MKRYLTEYYGNLYGLRAMEHETAGDKAGAGSCYATAARLFPEASPQGQFIRGRMSQLGR
jgi:hypothetical protein